MFRPKLSQNDNLVSIDFVGNEFFEQEKCHLNRSKLSRWNHFCRLTVSKTRTLEISISRLPDRLPDEMIQFRET